MLGSHRIERARDPSPSMPGRTPAEPYKAGGLRITNFTVVILVSVDSDPST